MGKVDLLPSVSPACFKVIFDSGASMAISPNKDHFTGPIEPCSKTLGGLANGMQIEGTLFEIFNGFLNLLKGC